MLTLLSRDGIVEWVLARQRSERKIRAKYPNGLATPPDLEMRTALISNIRREYEDQSRLTLCFKASVGEVVWLRFGLADFQLRFL
jgi:hypothetical protein